MRRTETMAWLWALGVVMAALVLSGCAWRQGGTDLATAQATQGSGQRTPIVVTPETVQVLTDQGVVDARILAEALSAVQDQGSVIYVDHTGIVRTPDGNVFVDGAGRTLKVRTITIAKLNSLQALDNLEGVEELRYVVGGRGYLADLPPLQQYDTGGPEALRLEIKGVSAARAVSPLPDVVAARTAERAAILAGLADVTRERWVGANRRIELLTNGLVRVTTSAGKAVTGVLLAASPAGAGLEALRVVVRDTDTQAVVEAIIEGE